MRNADLEEAHAGIKIARRNINNLRYAHNTALMAESEKELNSLLMRVKEESGKAGLKPNIQKNKDMASGPIMVNRWGKSGNSDKFSFLFRETTMYTFLSIKHTHALTCMINNYQT